MMNNFQIPQTRKTAIAALVLAAFLWSTAGLGFRLLTLSNGLAISGYRSFFAVLFYIAAYKALPKMEHTGWFKTGIIAYSCVSTLFVMANTLTTAANAIVLQYTSPIFACVFLFFIFKKPIPRCDLFAAVFILSGICIFFVDSLTLQASLAMTLGNAAAVTAGAGFGMMVIVVGRTTTPRNVFTLGNALNVVIALPFILLNPIESLFDLGVLLYLGIVQIGLAYLLFSFAVSKVSPLELILIPALEPILNPIWVFLFDGQAPSLLSVFGGVIIVSTILIWSVHKEKVNKNPSPAAE